MDPIAHEPRVVIVGYGRWGRCCHAALIDTTPGLCLHGIASGDPDKRAGAEAAFGCRTYECLDAVLADPDVDLVVLATPNSTHAEMAVRALNAGKHVLTEKAMCLTAAECDAMIAAARRNNRLLTVFQNRRYDGDFLTVRSLMADGTLGDVRWVEMSWQGFGIWGGWRGRRDMGGGKIYDLGPHLVDQLVVLLGRPVSVYCRAHHDFPEHDVESEGLLVIGFEGGATGVVDVSSLAAIQKPRFYVRGTSGTFMKSGLDPQERAMMDGNIDTAREPESQYGVFRNREGERPVPTLNGRWRTFFEVLRDALTLGTEAPVTLGDARRVIGVLDAAHRSAVSGQVEWL